MALRAYSPDQERDDHGRFGSGGGDTRTAEEKASSRTETLKTEESLAAFCHQAYDVPGYQTTLNAYVSPQGLDLGGGVHGVVYDGDKMVAEFSRTFPSDAEATAIGVPTGSVIHSDFAVRPDYQGRGFAAKLNEQAEAAYREAGFTSVQTYADIDVGKYAWAQQGFDMPKAELDVAKGGLARFIMDHEHGPMWTSGAALKDAEARVAAMGINHSWDLARADDGKQYAYKTRAQSADGHLGKAFMLSNQMISWHGTKSLDPSTESHRVGQTYIDTKTKVSNRLTNVDVDMVPLQIPADTTTDLSDAAFYDLSDESAWLAKINKVKNLYDPTADFRAVKAALRNYSPDQERDDHGRFGSGGGDSSGTLSQSEAKTFLDGHGVVSYHVTNESARDDMLKNGIDVTKGGGAFGQGFYTADKADMKAGAGSEKVAVAIRMDNPITVTARDAAHAEEYATFKALAEEHLGATYNPAGMREALLAKGFDGIIVPGSGRTPTWRIAIKQGSAKVVSQTKAQLENRYDPTADFKAVKAALLNYSPDQEREDNGRFGSGGLEPTKLTRGDVKELREGTYFNSDTGHWDDEVSKFDLTRDESAAVENYTGESGPVGCMAINASLRGTESKTAPTEATAKAVGLLDSAMSKSSGLAHDAILYRAVSAGLAKDLKAGDTFDEKGFLSTSYSNGGIWKMSYGGKENAILTIHAPAGTKALAGHSTMSEVILPRNLSFKVTEVKGRNVTVEVQ